MARPQPKAALAKTALAKAPTREHPVAPLAPAREDGTASEAMVLMSARVRRSTQRRLKIYAATTGQPVQAVVEAAIDAYLNQATS